MANNLPGFPPRTGANDVLSHLHRMNNSVNPMINRGGTTSYNPANAPNLLHSLTGNFSNPGTVGTAFPGTSSGGFGSGSETAPSPLDLSEFPSLRPRDVGSASTVDISSAGHIGSRHTYNSLGHGWGEGGKKGGGGGGGGTGAGGAGGGVNTNIGEVGDGNNRTSSSTPAQDKNTLKREVQITSDGKVTNIPAGMVRDQFGMVGILAFLKTVELGNDRIMLAHGTDVNSVGLNINTPENIYLNFGGPFADSHCRSQDIDYHVPQEYLLNQQIGTTKLAPIQFERLADDLLFYMFYTSVCDVWQLLAANELYNREWRYHKEERVWISRAPGMMPVEKTPSYERGTYIYFDAVNWRKTAKEFHLEYDKLDVSPTGVPLPQQQQPAKQQQQQQQQQLLQQHNHNPSTSALA